MRLAEHAGLVGVTFGSQRHDLLGVMYLARGTEPRHTVLLLHGCPGLEQNLDLAAELRDRGWNALVFHYRGCWGSGGRYDLRTITTDVAAAVDYLQDGDLPTVDRERIAVVGHSLGGWAAVLAAARDHRLRAVAVCGGGGDLGGIQRSGTLASVTEINQERTPIAVAPDGVRRVGIVGAGVIGGGWALHYLRMGFDVDVFDPGPEAGRTLLAMRDEIWPLLERIGSRPGASPDRIAFHADLAGAVADADMVQENTPEDGPGKRATIAAIH